jgi:hypothetical protein
MCRRLIKFGFDAEEKQGGNVAAFPSGILALGS